MLYLEEILGNFYTVSGRYVFELLSREKKYFVSTMIRNTHIRAYHYTYIRIHPVINKDTYIDIDDRVCRIFSRSRDVLDNVFRDREREQQ